MASTTSTNSYNSPRQSTRLKRGRGGQKVHKSRDIESKGEHRLSASTLHVHVFVRPQDTITGYLSVCHPHKTTNHLRATQSRLTPTIPFSCQGLDTQQVHGLFGLLTRGAPDHWLFCKWGRERHASCPIPVLYSPENPGQDPEAAGNPAAPNGRWRLSATCCCSPDWLLPLAPRLP